MINATRSDDKTVQLAHDIENCKIVLTDEEMKIIDELVESKNGDFEFCKSVAMYIVCKHIV